MVPSSQMWELAFCLSSKVSHLRSQNQQKFGILCLINDFNDILIIKIFVFHIWKIVWSRENLQIDLILEEMQGLWVSLCFFIFFFLLFM